MCKAKVAVCSEIREELNAKRTLCRIF